MYLPLSILEVSETFAWDNNLSNFKNVGIFTEQLKIVQPQIDNICKQTKNQTNSLKWLRQRKRKLTGSKFNQIYTRNLESTFETLLGGIMFETAAIKHEMTMEHHAKSVVKHLILV